MASRSRPPRLAQIALRIMSRTEKEKLNQINKNGGERNITLMTTLCRSTKTHSKGYRYTAVKGAMRLRKCNDCGYRFTTKQDPGRTRPQPRK